MVNHQVKPVPAMQAIVLFGLFATAAIGQDSLPSLNSTPQTVEQLWDGYDPQAEPLNARVVRQWREDGVTLRYVTYEIGTFKGKSATMAAFYGFPTSGKKLPAVMHMHGGGQRAFLQIVKRYAKRGYATLSVNWGGRMMEDAQPGEANTDWGAVDPTQTNVAGYSNLLPQNNTIDPFPSARNNNWFLLTVGCRRGITFLEQQPEVDADRIGVFGHSMGGRLTGLVAGADERVKAASPSVGGSGFLQTNLWGLPGSARRVRGDVGLFQKTIAGQAYLPRVRCPILYLSATNDFNAPMDFVERGMQLVPHENKRTTYAPHLNHRFTPEAEIARPLWFDSHLQNRLNFPKTPVAELILKTDNGVPVFRVHPDSSLPIQRVDIYYGYERDPRNRFWADARATSNDGTWEAACPVFDMDEPLFAFANVYYRLSDNQRREGDPETFAISVARTAYPNELNAANVKATERSTRLIDDFSRRFHDWYTLNIGNQHHWFVSTRKLADPRWEAPRGAKLSLEIEPTEAGNTLAVELRTDNWRGYSGRRPDAWTALVPLENSGRQRVQLAVDAFRNSDGGSLADWYGITELSFQAGAKSKHPSAANLPPWKGEVPAFFDLRWDGGEPVRRPKPFLPSSNATQGLNRSEFQRAIDDSIRREQLDKGSQKRGRSEQGRSDCFEPDEPTNTPGKDKTIHVPADSPTIQAAIDSAKDGDVVLVTAGTYRERIVLKRGVTLKSAGDNSKGKLGLARAEATVIDGANRNGNRTGAKPGVTMAAGSVLDGFTITRIGKYDDALWKKHHATQGNEQSHEHIGAAGTPGVAIHGVNCEVRNNIVHHIGYTGIAITGVSKRHCSPLVESNICYRNMGGGIGSMKGSTATIRDNMCFENFYAGIGNDGASPLIIENTCYQNIRAGIGISEGSSPIVRGNRCYGNRRAGIGVRSGASTRPAIEDNDCYRNDMAGIGTEDHAAPVITKNRCYGNKLAGIGCREHTTPTIVENECYKNGTVGIGQESNAITTLIRNHCHDNLAAGIGFAPCKSGRSTLIENRVINNAKAAIGIQSGWTVTATKNVLTREGGLPPIVMIFTGARANFVQNTISGEGVAGIRVAGELTATDNTLTCPKPRKGGPPSFGVWELDGSTVTLSGNTFEGWRSNQSSSNDMRRQQQNSEE